MGSFLGYGNYPIVSPLRVPLDSQTTQNIYLGPKLNITLSLDVQINTTLVDPSTQHTDCEMMLHQPVGSTF